MDMSGFQIPIVQSFFTSYFASSLHQFMLVPSTIEVRVYYRNHLNTGHYGCSVFKWYGPDYMRLVRLRDNYLNTRLFVRYSDAN